MSHYFYLLRTKRGGVIPVLLILLINKVYTFLQTKNDGILIIYMNLKYN